jgi:hypothetical protein
VGAFSSEEVLSLLGKLETAVVEVQDPVYRERKRYEALSLQDVLTAKGVRARDLDLVFRALDGYTPVVSPERLPSPMRCWPSAMPTLVSAAVGSRCPGTRLILVPSI